MKKALLEATMIILLLTGCHNAENSAVNEASRPERAPAPGKVSGEAHEKRDTPDRITCFFDNPDTSVSGIQIRMWSAS